MLKLLSFLALLFCSPALAAEPLPEIKEHIEAEVPFGETTYSLLFWDVYDITLWTDADAWSYDNNFALSIIYDMAFTTEELVGKTIEEMDRLSDLSEERLESFRPELEASFPNVAEGDRITALYIASQQEARFYHNGKLTTSIKHDDFYKPFFSIWLSENAERRSLRDKLLRL